jgi:hypothetical protein
MIRLRSLSTLVVAGVVLAITAACDTKAPSAPTTPPVPVLGTTVLLGTVLHSQNRTPVPGALVTLNVQVGTSATHSAVTTSDGTFRIEAVMTGLSNIKVEAAGFLELSQQLNLTGTEVRAELAMIPSGPPPPPPQVLTSVGGLVTNRLTSLPINGATLTLVLTTGERFTATTGVDGQFMIHGVPVGAVGDLRVTANGHRAEDQRFTVEPNLFVTVGLDPG